MAASMRDYGREGKWLWFCEPCSKALCLIGYEGVKYGPVGRQWGYDRFDPMLVRFRSARCKDVTAEWLDVSM
jgi:hypothetical protein